MAMFYINKQGGTQSPSLLYLAVALWECCLTHHVYLTAVHVVGQGNDVVDLLSYKESEAHKWELEPEVF